MRVKFEAGGLERGEDYRPLRNNGTEKYAKAMRKLYDSQ
jgi:hypothetical protein